MLEYLPLACLGGDGLLPWQEFQNLGRRRIVDIILFQVGFNGWTAFHFFCFVTGSISCILELILSFNAVIYVTLESNEVCGRSHQYCWWLPGFLQASFSGSVLCSLAVSMSTSVVLLRGAKKSLVNTDFGGSMKAVDVMSGLILDVCEVLSEIRLLHLFTSWKSSPWAINSMEVLFTTQLCSSVHSVLPCTCHKKC